MTDRLLLLVAVLAVSALVWWWTHRADGRFAAPDRPSPDGLGLTIDAPATFVLISSSGCSTCPQVRRVLTQVVAEVAGADLIEIAAEERMDLVRRLGVLRTPTVLLVDARGRISSRTSGPIRADQARAALEDLLVPTGGAR